MMRALFTISLFELFIGGGGRLIAVGPVSLRMVLFAACLCATVIAMLFPRRRSDGVRVAMLMVLAYLLVHVAALLVGSLNGDDALEMLQEFQQSLYWLAAPFYAFMLQTDADVRRCSRIVQAAGVTLASLYVLILIGLISGIVPLPLLRHLIGPSGEVVFRSGEFFIYKGFLYLGIAVVFFVAIQGKYWGRMTIFVLFAMVLTFTRGFIISTSAAVLLMLCIQGRWRAAVPAIVLVVLAAFAVWVYLPSLDTSVLSSHDASTNERIADMLYMSYHATANTFLFGEGYGAVINDRFLIENTFLWALWKLGTIGLLFWMFPMFLCTYYYLKTPNRRSNAHANAYLFGTVLVYVQTAVNPFLNNPIGLSFVMLAMFSLRVMSRPGRVTAPARGALSPAAPVTG